jgi:hypothetical protein
LARADACLNEQTATIWAMTTTKTYQCWFLINQDQEKREFVSLETEASRLFTDFISRKDYGSAIGLFRFDIYITPTINYGLHYDRTYNGTAHLTANIDKQFFEKSTEHEKIKQLLTTSLILIKHLEKKVPIPKGFNATELAIDYEKYLVQHALLIETTLHNKIIYKHFNTTRFNFIRTETIEVDKKKIHFDLNEIEDFINNSIAGKVFGNSIKSFDFGFELYDFKGGFADFLKQTDNYKRYGTKYKNFLVVKHFDYSLIKNLDKKKQFGLLKFKILEGINDFDHLKKKPKDFDKNKFHTTIDTILTEYENQQLD